MLSAGMLALAAGLLSPVPARWRWAVAAVLIAALVVLDLRSRKLAVPQRDQLIPQEVFHDGMRWGLLRFGAEYGTGFRTLIPSAAPYVLALGLLAANLPAWQTIAAGAAFGAGRAIAALQLVIVDAPGFQAFLTGHRRILERAATVATALCMLLAAIA